MDKNITPIMIGGIVVINARAFESVKQYQPVSLVKRRKKSLKSKIWVKPFKLPHKRNLALTLSSAKKGYLVKIKINCRTLWDKGLKN